MEGGRHLLLANRAGAQQALGNAAAALPDADEAAACSPAGFHTAYIRQVPPCLHALSPPPPPPPTTHTHQARARMPAPQLYKICSLRHPVCHSDE